MSGRPLNSSGNGTDGVLKQQELKQRVDDLERQLKEAKVALSFLEQTPVAGGNSTAPSTDGTSLSHGPGTHSVASKSGYLFKWKDRSIGWGGTKWALRFVRLDRGRISYSRSHSDGVPRYILTLRGCAVRDDGFKVNVRHRSKSKGTPPLTELGAYFHVFSIYHRLSSNSQKDGDKNEGESEEDLIIPLLRFSTTSLAEKTQWIQLLSEACAYCDSDAFLSDEDERRLAELRRQQELQEVTRPKSKRGTLPPMYFGAAPLPPPKRLPSGAKHPKAANMYRTRSGNLLVAKSNSQSVSAYPPSKPMHRSSEPSYLSAEAPVQNYRGLFNLAMILLILSNFRILLHTFEQHGFILLKPIDLSRFSHAPLSEFPVLSGIALVQCFIWSTFCIEWLLSRKKVGEIFGMFLHYMNSLVALTVPMVIVWHYIEYPVVGAALLGHATITWMKLFSYLHANQDYRTTPERDTHRATLALVENLYEDDKKLAYPRNISLKNIYYFWLAPTLTYQMAFPRTEKIRFLKVIGILLRIAFLSSLFLFLFAQIVSPNLDRLVKDLEATDGVYTTTMLADYWLKLSLANTYLWLLMFYIFFHLFLNLMAELLCFGDRVFYKDWWNSSEVSAYWRLWNIPVHYWLVRHLYFPCIRLKMSKSMATFMVFFFSSVIHEMLISVPFHMIRHWSFTGMMFQIPLVTITKFIDKKFPGSSVGNIIFWIAFCVVGQPMAIMMYTIDYRFLKSSGEVPEMVCHKTFWGAERCEFI